MARRWRIRSVSEEHYFTAEPTTPNGRHTVSFTAGGADFRLVSAPGVFSKGRLDPGTAVLLRKAPLPGPQEAGPLLDLGCGYGPVGLTLAVTAVASTVYCVDVNRRALELTRENAEQYQVADRVVAASPEQLPADLRFRQIWSNPPIRIGKSELHDLMEAWLPRLTDDGVAWLVVAKYLGGDSLQQWLTERGWAVDRTASSKGYRVLRVSRP